MFDKPTDCPKKETGYSDKMTDHSEETTDQEQTSSSGKATGSEQTIDSEQRIALNKVKILLIALGCFGFVAIGFFILITHDNYWLFSAIFAMAILAFAFGGGFAMKTFFDSRPGLTLSTHGIFDNSNGIACGDIPWSDVTEIHYLTNMLVIQIRYPDRYIERGNLFQRVLKRSVYKRFSSPICINADSLRIDFHELQAKTKRYFDHYQQGN